MAEGQETIVLLALVLIGLGFANCFYGYRIFRLTLSLVGFLAGLALGIGSFSTADRVGHKSSQLRKVDGCVGI